MALRHAILLFALCLVAIQAASLKKKDLLKAKLDKEAILKSFQAVRPVLPKSFVPAGPPKDDTRSIQTVLPLDRQPEVKKIKCKGDTITIDTHKNTEPDQLLLRLSPGTIISGGPQWKCNLNSGNGNGNGSNGNGNNGNGNNGNGNNEKQGFQVVVAKATKSSDSKKNKSLKVETKPTNSFNTN